MLRQKSQTTLKVNDLHFQYRLRERMFGAKLAILAQICYKLSPRQCKFSKIPSQCGQNDLDGLVQKLLFQILAQSISGCMFDENLVISAGVCGELFHGQAEFPRILSQNGQNDLEGRRQ